MKKGHSPRAEVSCSSYMLRGSRAQRDTPRDLPPSALTHCEMTFETGCCAYLHHDAQRQLGHSPFLPFVLRPSLLAPRWRGSRCLRDLGGVRPEARLGRSTQLPVPSSDRWEKALFSARLARQGGPKTRPNQASFGMKCRVIRILRIARCAVGALCSATRGGALAYRQRAKHLSNVVEVFASALDVLRQGCA
jgi:hypothetical protein